MSTVVDSIAVNHSFSNVHSQTVVRFATRDEGQRAASKIVDEMQSLGYSDRSLFAMKTSLIEAIANAIKHGHGNDQRKVVEVRYIVDGIQAVVEVEDQGEGFDLERVPDPTVPENLERTSGRGVLMMHQFLSWVEFNERGNCVTLCEYFNSDG